MCFRKKSKKRKSGEVPTVFGVDSKDMRHGKQYTIDGVLNGLIKPSLLNNRRHNAKAHSLSQ